ncbi:phosphatase PAP2 family protein [Flexivirga caeni]|nr:phosphatase PAP2 family protein [Flexivirga caeni]
MVAAGEESVPTSLLSRVRWDVVRWAAISVYLVALAIFCVTRGVPMDRAGLTLWIVTGLSAVCIGKGWRAWGRMMLDWLPFQGVLLLYDYSYGAASYFSGGFIDGFPIQGAINRIGMPLHVTFPIRVDEWLFGGHLPSQWVQQHLSGAVNQAPWWSIFITLCYCSHFMVSPIVAAVLWIRSRERFRAWAALLVALAVAGIATYFVFPMSPPWLASQQGYISGTPVYRLSGQGWSWLDFHGAAQVLGDAQDRSNPVAAMPSLHLATATLVIGFFWFSVRRWVRPFLLLYPALMSFTLIYSGEHYVTDEIAGLLYAVVLLAAWRVLRRRPLHLPGWLGGAGVLSSWRATDREALLDPADRPVDVVQHG